MAERYRGEAYHTGQWPKEPVEFAGKKVAVIGTGASAVQLIPEIAKEVAELVVYQRTPNWNSPLNNGKITDEEQAEIRATYEQIYESCMSSFAGFVHRASPKRTFDDPKDERWALYECFWLHQKGFAKLISNYRDLMTNREANAEFSEFIAAKIRERVNDPAVAEKLIPTDHGLPACAARRWRRSTTRRTTAERDAGDSTRPRSSPSPRPHRDRRWERARHRGGPPASTVSPAR
ncbi:MAG: hypothetical protein R2749_17755 [Acidimicrobiales bacterium]